MKAKEKVLLIWILVAVAIGFLLSHFCSGAVQAMEHFIVSTLPSAAGPAHCTVALRSVRLLSSLA